MLDRREKDEEVEEEALVEKEETLEDLSETPNVVDDCEGENSRSGQAPLQPSQQARGASPTGPAQRTGRWTPDEKILFLYGLKRFGKGRWKKMSIYLPHRLVLYMLQSFGFSLFYLLKAHKAFFFKFKLFQVVGSNQESRTKGSKTS